LTSRLTLCRRLQVVVLVLLTCPGAMAQTTEQFEFFEKRVRPILINHCYKCHVGAKCESGLELDSREHVLAGGDRGPAIVPGRPDQSLLIQAVRHLPGAELQMPPEEKLSDDQIADLASWIAMGAPWPAAFVPPRQPPSDQQRRHWAFQPLTRPAPPAVDDVSWPATDVDRFILARLEAAGLKPTAAADRRTLIRRATFDLIGLPPTPEEIEDFVADASPAAWSKVVDRLLASPRYGERWARHWLDLVRYAETDGHEFDTDKPNAYHYRDYVIEAFNADLPYDAFIREQVAGDLLPPEMQRISSDAATRLSPIGTGFFYLGEVQNNPVEPERDLANQVEDQLDVLGKTFLGLTVGCARCHDHKFDPISSADYYALAGFLYSTQKTQQCVDTPARAAAVEARRQELAGLRREMEQIVGPARRAARLDQARRMKDYLLAARKVLGGTASYRRAEIELASARGALEPSILQAWVDYLAKLENDPDGIFDLWASLATASDGDFAGALGKWLSTVQPAAQPKSEVFADFDSDELSGWRRVGQAFGAIGQNDSSLAGIDGAAAATSKRGTDRLVGRLVSDPFTVKRPYLWFRLSGGHDPRKLRFSLCINGQPIPTFTATGNGHDHLELHFLDVHTVVGKQAYLEIVDEQAAPGGHLSVDDIRFADGPPPAWHAPNALIRQAAESASDAVTLAAALQRLFAAALSNSNAADRGPAADLLRWALRDDIPLAAGEQFTAGDPLSPAVRRHLSDAEIRRFESLAAACQRLERDFPLSTTALVAQEHIPRDAWFHVRGEHTNKGPRIPRGYLSCIGPQDPPPDRNASGRLQLAHWIASPENPLTARVIVNRIWQHHFGQGLVKSVDNFGLSGEPPSHPLLLDYLATWFIDQGWSIKSLHRLIMLSSVYQLASEPSPPASRMDTDNRLLAYWRPRRIEAECIRDAMLAVAGKLNCNLYGPSVPLHLTEEIEGRDVPPVSGPLDGDCRRSIYLEVRRNHLTPLLAAFDFPRPIGTVGARQSSAVPSQALALLNNAFVRQQAGRWASRILAQYPSDDGRVTRMYLEALGRPPDAFERQAAARFIHRQAENYARISRDAQRREQAAWADFGQVLFNVGEFSFVR
jgi:cytochrome c553